MSNLFVPLWWHSCCQKCPHRTRPVCPPSSGSHFHTDWTGKVRCCIHLKSDWQTFSSHFCSHCSYTHRTHTTTPEEKGTKRELCHCSVLFDCLCFTQIGKKGNQNYVKRHVLRFWWSSQQIKSGEDEKEKKFHSHFSVWNSVVTVQRYTSHKPLGSQNFPSLSLLKGGK